MFCSKCGAQIKENSTFCVRCGANQKLEEKLHEMKETQMSEVVEEIKHNINSRIDDTWITDTSGRSVSAAEAEKSAVKTEKSAIKNEKKDGKGAKVTLIILIILLVVSIGAAGVFAGLVYLGDIKADKEQTTETAEASADSKADKKDEDDKNADEVNEDDKSADEGYEYTDGYSSGYVNHVELLYPDSMVEITPGELIYASARYSESDMRAMWKDEELGAELVFWTNGGSFDAENLMRGELDKAVNLTYSDCGDRWFAVSYWDGDTGHYIKGLLNEDKSRVWAFDLAFTRENSENYINTYIPYMEEHFRSVDTEPGL